MLGAIIGDIVGSVYEFENIHTKDFELFTYKNEFTDDSILTIAIAKAILECKNDYTKLSEEATKWMVKLGRKYPGASWGGSFYDWLFTDNHEPYNSFGNGSAMRVSPCGWVAHSLEEARDLATKVTIVSHNHPEGIKGACCIAECIYLLRNKATKEDIRKYVNDNYYTLDFTYQDRLDDYDFYATCQESVPEAIICFLESTSFEDAIRNAISIGGDSDTIADMSGALAEAYYGIPEDIVDDALSYLDDDLQDIVDEFTKLIK